MKKIIFVCDSLRIGGIQTALVNLINNLNLEKYKIDLFLFNDENSEKKIDSRINIISGSKFLKTCSYTLNQAKEKGKICYLIRGFVFLLCKVFGANLVYNCIFLFEKNLKEYDIAISFSNNGSIKSTYFGYNKFVLKKIEAKKKVSWLHVDYETMKMNNKINNREYKLFDCVVAVSNATMKSFLKYIPEMKNKTIVIYNYLDFDTIKRKSLENTKYEFDNNLFNIVSVGRLDSNKNQIMQLEIAKKLCDNNIKFKWYLIGDGPERTNLENYIINNKLENCVIMLGYINNCYPYIKKSNLVVSTSLSESYGLSLIEALSLKKIVVTLEYPAVYEIINDNGIVCQSKDIIYETIKKIIIDKKYYNENEKKAKNIIDNEMITKKIDTLFEVLL